MKDESSDAYLIFLRYRIHESMHRWIHSAVSHDLFWRRSFIHKHSVLFFSNRFDILFLLSTIRFYTFQKTKMPGGVFYLLEAAAAGAELEAAAVEVGVVGNGFRYPTLRASGPSFSEKKALMRLAVGIEFG
jgi:hypothetical protein